MTAALLSKVGMATGHRASYPTHNHSISGMSTPVGPAPSIRRLPRYLDVLYAERSRGQSTASTTLIAKTLGFTAIQVRKDLALTGIVGKPRVGYNLEELITSIEHFLGWDKVSDTFLVGAGHLGRALLGFPDFEQHGLRIVGAFDSNPDLIGSTLGDHPILCTSRLANLAKRMGIRVVVLTVPREHAQSVADELIRDAGIEAIWNFSDPDLQVPEHVVLETVRLDASLALLCTKLQALKGTGS